MGSATLPHPDDLHPAIIGLGYVGLPLAAAFGRQLDTLGFDINAQRIADLQAHQDHTLEVSADELKSTRNLRFSSDPADLADRNVFIVTVPTPIDDARRPDLGPLEAASRTVGRAIGKGGVANVVLVEQFANGIETLGIARRGDEVYGRWSRAWA